MEYEQFDRRLARECAKAFSQSTGLGCTLSDKTGRAFDEYGYGCESCGMCAAAGASHDRCVQAHIYGMTEAERFGGARNGAVFDGGDVVAQNSHALSLRFWARAAPRRKSRSARSLW